MLPDQFLRVTLAIYYTSFNVGQSHCIALLLSFLKSKLHVSSTQLLWNIFYKLMVLNSGVKTWKLTSNFPNRKSFWHITDINILSRKILGYKHRCVQNKVFMMSQILNMAEFAKIMYPVNGMSQEMGLPLILNAKLTFWQTLRYRISKTSHCA